MTYIPQHRSVFPWLTVHENLIMGSQGLAKNQLKAKLNEIYEQYPVLKNKKHDLAMNLSGGQQRMLEFARAMLREPKVMLIDEPTTALDPKSTKLVYDEISKLKNKNIAVLLVDQNVRMAVEICDFLAVMRDGQIIIQRDKENIRDQIIDIVKEWLI
jgi:branched-chain amino acid transport system ATP-binding protein